MSFSYFRDVLPSGLRVVTVETPHLHTAVVAAYVRVGSRHENAQNNGVSHFLEHLFFRGSAGFPDTVRMNAAVEEVGGNLNGVTTRDHSYYYTPLHPKHLDVGMGILGDMLARPRLSDFDVEREVILEEMLDEVDENGRDIDLDNVAKMRLFGKHPLAFKIAGTRDSVRAMKKGYIEEHLQTFYRTSNVVLTVAGQVTRAEVLELAEKTFAGLPKGAVEAPETPPTIDDDGPSFEHVLHPEAQTEMQFAFPTAPERHPDFTTLQIIRRVLDDGLSSRLPFEIVEKRGLAYSVHAGIETYDDVGIFEIEAASTPDKAAQVASATLQALGELCEKGPTEEELARAKRRNRIFLDFAQDSPADLASWFGATELFRIPETFAQRAAEADLRTAEDVRRVATKYFHAKNLRLTAIGPKKGVANLKKAVLAADGLPRI